MACVEMMAQRLSSVEKSESWCKPKRVDCLKRPLGASEKICDRARQREESARLVGRRVAREGERNLWAEVGQLYYLRRALSLWGFFRHTSKSVKEGERQGQGRC